MSTEQSTAHPVTVLMRAYYSSYHLWAARDFASKAGEIEKAHSGRSRFDLPHRAYVTSAVLSSVAFMEALINEFYQDIADRHPGFRADVSPQAHEQIQTFWDAAEGRKFGVLEKVQMALVLCGRPSFPKGQAPYQDAALLIELRNELVHYKPKDLGGGIEHRLDAKLQNKFPLNALMAGAGNPFFPDHLLGAGCANWAAASALALADAFAQAVDLHPNYKHLPTGLRTPQP